MRHYQDPRNAPLFRGGELVRLATMIVMLGVTGMLILRARDPQTWRWFTRDDDTVSPGTLAARDRVYGKKPARDSAGSRPKSAERLMLAQAPSPESAEKAPIATEPNPAAPGSKPAAPARDPAAPEPGPAAPAPPVAAVQPTNGAPKPGLADDVPPPEPATAPAPEKPAAAGEGGKPVTGEPGKATPAAGRDSSAGLATDIPPPEPAVDPDFLRKITEPEFSPGTATSPGSFAPSTSQPAEMSGEPSKESLAELPPIDQDSEELADFQDECQAITDKDVLRPEEMFAYWRLVRWEQKQNYKELEKRARRDLMFTHFFEKPSKHRGELVRLKLRIVRAAAHDAEDNGLGVKRVFEAWGCTDESYPNPYCIVVTDLPADFPLKHDMQEDVTFCGFFLKTMAYRAKDEKTRAAPLLIGRVLWHPISVPTMPVSANWLWGSVVGGLAIMMLIARLTFNFRPTVRPSTLPPLHDGEEGIPIETWLERAETSPTEGEMHDSAINPLPDGDKQVNGAGHVFPERLDRTEDQER